MANKKVSQLVSKPSVLVTDLFPIADPTTGQLFKTTISDLGTAIGSGVSSVNTLVGAVVLDTDDIQELASPTNRWFTDTRARASISGGTGISYNSGTGVITNAVTSGQIATALGYTPADGANYLPLAGGTMGGAITGTIATFASSSSVTALGITLSGASGDGVKITHSAGRAFNIQSSGSGFGILINNETASTSAPFTIQKQGLAVITLTDAGAGSFASSLTANSFIKTSGTSAQFLKADGSVDSTSYQPILTNPVTGTGTSGIVAKFSGTSAITDSIIYDNGTRVSIGANVTTSNTFTAVASTTSAYAVVAQASGAANGFWAVLSGTGEIFRGQTNGGSYFIVNNGGNAFLNGNLNIGDFGSTSFKLNVIGTANITGALSGTSASFSSTLSATGNLTIGNAVAGTNVKIILNGVASKAAGFEFHQSGTPQWYLGNGIASEDNNFELYNSNGTMAMKIIKSTNAINFTGATSFSTSITTGSASVSSDILVSLSTDTGAFAIKNVRASHSFSIYDHQAGVDRLWITSGGNVGIGTTSPGELLHLSKVTYPFIKLTETTASTSAQFGYDSPTAEWRMRTLTSTPLTFGTNDTERMRITSGGEVLVNTTSPRGGNVKLTVNGVLRAGDNTNEVFSGAGSGAFLIDYPGVSGGRFNLDNNGALTIRGALTQNASDERLKNNIKTIPNALQKILTLRGVTFHWDTEIYESGRTTDIGVIAQDVQAILPDAVALAPFDRDISTGKSLSGKNYLTVYYEKLIPLLIESVKDLKAELDTLKNK